jgi:hypothetical protein
MIPGNTAHILRRWLSGFGCVIYWPCPFYATLSPVLPSVISIDSRWYFCILSERFSSRVRDLCDLVDEKSCSLLEVIFAALRNYPSPFVEVHFLPCVSYHTMRHFASASWMIGLLNCEGESWPYILAIEASRTYYTSMVSLEILYS